VYAANEKIHLADMLWLKPSSSAFPSLSRFFLCSINGPTTRRSDTLLPSNVRGSLSLSGPGEFTRVRGLLISGNLSHSSHRRRNLLVHMCPRGNSFLFSYGTHQLREAHGETSASVSGTTGSPGVWQCRFEGSALRYILGKHGQPIASSVALLPDVMIESSKPGKAALTRAQNTDTGWWGRSWPH
jgi:hypothetical protein